MTDVVLPPEAAILLDAELRLHSVGAETLADAVHSMLLYVQAVARDDSVSNEAGSKIEDRLGDLIGKLAKCR